MYQQYSYEEVLSAAERFAWRVEDLIGGERRLDFAKPFLPDPLARTDAMTWLAPEQRRVANQIRGAGYLGMFGLVEEFVLPFVLDHVRPQLNQDDYRVSKTGYYDHLVAMFQQWQDQPDVKSGKWPATLEAAFGIAK